MSLVASAVLCCLLAVPAIAEAKVKPTSTQIVVGDADLESISLELSSASEVSARSMA